MKTDEEYRAYCQSLPGKRMGAGVLFFDMQGRVLLVKPTYKDHWEIPGGVVEKDESPRTCMLREVQEEIGLDVPVGRLLCVDYREDDGVRTESLMFIFDGGELSEVQIAAIRLQEKELSSYEFVAPGRLLEYLDEIRLGRRVLSCLETKAKNRDVYLEQGAHVCP